MNSLGATAVSKNLHDIIRARDLVGLQTEFNRIYENLEADPPAAVTVCSLRITILGIHRRQPS
jgi:hypothetical protein